MNRSNINLNSYATLGENVGTGTTVFAGKKERIIKPDGFCIYYKKGIGYEIYDKRPQTCRDYERGGEICIRTRENFKALKHKKINKNE